MAIHLTAQEEAHVAAQVAAWQAAYEQKRRADAHAGAYDDLVAALRAAALQMEDYWQIVSGYEGSIRENFKHDYALVRAALAEATR